MDVVWYMCVTQIVFETQQIFGILGLIGVSIPRKVHQGGGVDDETLWKETTEVNFIDTIEDDLSEHLL